MVLFRIGWGVPLVGELGVQARRGARRAPLRVKEPHFPDLDHFANPYGSQ